MTDLVVRLGGRRITDASPSRPEEAASGPPGFAERRVLKIITVTFYALAAYVLAGSVTGLATRAHPERSPPASP
ncbi:MAG: hypothetical protein M3Z75_03885 [Actinomycetota bacterium]|jgi:hypothetical protein|nr:hypothetical protein [Actinomycetota bacterium]